MGRTGRKREGRVVFLLTEGKEERDHVKSQDSYEKIQKKIASGNEFEFDLDNSPRILPPEIQPDCVKKEIIPPNETTDALELKVDRRKKVPKYQKDWSLPEDVETGFVRASAIGNRKRQNSENTAGFSRPAKPAKRKRENAPHAFVDPDSLISPYMTKEEENKVRERRIRVSPIPIKLDVLDTSNSSIPSGSARKRLDRTRQAMRDPTRALRIPTDDDFEEFNSTPPDLIAVEESRRNKLSERDVNATRRNGTSDSSPHKPETPDNNPFKNWEKFDELLMSSSGDELPDLSIELLRGTAGLEKKRGKDSDEEYGLPSEFEITPRKRIRIQLSSDED